MTRCFEHFEFFCGRTYCGCSQPVLARVTLDAEGQLVLKSDNQSAYRLAPRHGRRFRIVELEGFAVEFRGEGMSMDEVIFHQSNGTLVARRSQG